MGFRAGYLLVIGGSGHVYGVGRGHERAQFIGAMLSELFLQTAPLQRCSQRSRGGGRGGSFRTVRGVVGFASHTQKSSGTPWINLQEIDHFVAFAELPWQTIRLGYLEPALFLAQFMMM